MNLIITPVYNAFDRVKQMCDALDTYSTMPFMHILVDDNSKEPLNESTSGVKVTANRKILRMNTDYPEQEHKNNLGQGVQLGYDFAHFAHFNEVPCPEFEHVFLIESDCIVHPEWDKKMLEVVPTLPEDWGSLDCQSVDEEGKLTYPTVISPRHGFITEQIEHQHYADFQCTLFHPDTLPEKSGIKWSDFRSHFDILWSRKVEELLNKKHYRTMLVSLTHYASSSRNTLPKT